MTMPLPEPEFLKIAEAAEVLNVTTDRTRWHVESGHLTAYHAGAPILPPLSFSELNGVYRLIGYNRTVFQNEWGTRIHDTIRVDERDVRLATAEVRALLEGSPAEYPNLRPGTGKKKGTFALTIEEILRGFVPDFPTCMEVAYILKREYPELVTAVDASAKVITLANGEEMSFGTLSGKLTVARKIVIAERLVVGLSKTLNL
jgi:hypothetical protein